MSDAPQPIAPSPSEIVALDFLQHIRALHLGIMNASWIDCVALAEVSVARRTDPYADDDQRRAAVFELAHLFFACHAPHLAAFGDFLQTFEKMKTGESKP